MIKEKLQSILLGINLEITRSFKYLILDTGVKDKNHDHLTCLTFNHSFLTLMGQIESLIGHFKFIANLHLKLHFTYICV